MKTLLTLTFAVFSTFAMASCPRPWVCEDLKLPVPYSTLAHNVKFESAKIRAGFLAHEGEFKGNVLYFQGLGDSMLNHDPLFKKVSKAGFRVIAFDYMGQGGSTGRMNKTRIEYIPWIGQRVWNKFALNTTAFPQKNIIGWSTGGLAAYYAASENKADKIILIAPGIAPRTIVGEGLFNSLPNEITLQTLTTDHYFDVISNPHRDPIKPNSPVKVPHFSANLLMTAHHMRDAAITTRTKGLVLLSGEEDTYVNAERTRRIIMENAEHFVIKSYAGALHEIDNEREEIRNKAHRDIINFLLN